jgi:glycosyltransferase involved in cell wall biosynthesis
MACPLRRILFISTVTPDPNGRGIDRRAAQHLEALSRIGVIDLVLPDSESDPHRASALNPAARLNRIIVRPSTTVGTIRLQRCQSRRTRFGRLFSMITLLPDLEHRAHPADARYFAEQFSGEGYSLVFAFRLPSATWIESLGPFASSLPKIVDFDDIESLAYARRLNLEPRPMSVWRWRERAFCHRLARLERGILKRWTAVLVCSSVDQARLGTRTPAIVHIVPNTVTVLSSPPPPSQREGFEVLFVGTLDYEPNAVGLVWFLKDGWPHVRAASPGARLNVVGRNPPSAIWAHHGCEGIVVHGRVEDLAPFYIDAHVAIAPILSGGGTRIKILEAFAHARAVVATTAGCEGIPAASGHHLVVANTPADFARSLIDLAHDAHQRNTLGINGFMLANEHCERAAVQANFAAWVELLLGGYLRADRASAHGTSVEPSLSTDRRSAFAADVLDRRTVPYKRTERA